MPVGVKKLNNYGLFFRFLRSMYLHEGTWRQILFVKVCIFLINEFVNLPILDM